MYDVLLGDTAEIARLDGMGLISPIDYENASGGAPWWSDIIQQGISTTPAIIAASKGAKGSGIPSYPGGGPVMYGYSQVGGAYNPGVSSDGTVTLSPSGIRSQGSFNISTNMLVIGGLALALVIVMSGKRR